MGFGTWTWSSCPLFCWAACLRVDWFPSFVMKQDTYSWPINPSHQSFYFGATLLLSTTFVSNTHSYCCMALSAVHLTPASATICPHQLQISHSPNSRKRWGQVHRRCSHHHRLANLNRSSLLVQSLLHRTCQLNDIFAGPSTRLVRP